MNEKELIKIIVQSEINKAINYYGIELTEEKIKQIYRNMPYVMNKMLREYYTLTHQTKQLNQLEKES